MATGTGRSEVEEARALLERRGHLPVTVDGGSMEPAVRRGGTLLVTRPREPRPGDVALLATREGLLLHRLVARAGPWFAHRGDASPVWGVAGRKDVLGIAGGVGAGPRDGRAAFLLGLAALLRHLGIPLREV